MDQRNKRINYIQMTTPDTAIFEGFGGSSIDQETLVFTLHNAPFAPYSAEVRIPVNPTRFSPAEVMAEYACYSGADWDEVLELVRST